jgi:hypothetical protein
MSEAEYGVLLKKEIEDKEQENQKDMENRGRSFMGKKALLSQRHTDSPRTREPKRNLNPQAACKSKWHRIEALQRLKCFLSDYKEALKRWRQGVHDVMFPAGTYAMRLHAGVRCREPDTPAPG